MTFNFWANVLLMVFGLLNLAVVIVGFVNGQVKVLNIIAGVLCFVVMKMYSWKKKDRH